MSYSQNNYAKNSYSHKKIPQQSFGFIFVVAFHLLLIWALANGLRDPGGISLPPALIAQVLQESIMPEPLPVPKEPNIQSNNLPENVAPLPVIAIEPSTEPTGIAQPQTVTPTQPALSRPSIIKATKPVYPATAIYLGEEGATGLELYITAQGKVADVKLFSSSGSTRLDEAAIKHARHNWTFSPCIEKGVAVACWFKTKLVWRIADTHKN